MPQENSEGYIKARNLHYVWARILPSLKGQYPNIFFSISGAALGLLPFIFGPIKNFGVRLFPIVDQLGTDYVTLIAFILTGFAIFTTTDQKFLVALHRHEVNRGSKIGKISLLNLHLLNFVKLLI